MRLSPPLVHLSLLAVCEADTLIPMNQIKKPRLGEEKRGLRGAGVGERNAEPGPLIPEPRVFLEHLDSGVQPGHGARSAPDASDAQPQLTFWS